MIDCLSNPAWINPQTEFLLVLQNFRTGYFESFDKFFLSITVLGEYWLPTIVCAIVYWCIDSKAGVYLFSLEGLNVIFSHIAKMLACVYRPWVLDNRIHPSPLAFPYAKGYSFPSGHSCMSSSVFGGLAFVLRNNKKWVFMLVSLVLLVGFSRLWLGVHTPQDVAGGFLIGIVMIFGVHPIIEWAEENKNRYLFFALIVDILSVIALIYINFFNQYRTDYVNGELLVNPQKMVYLTNIVCSYGLGLFNGCCLCRRFFPFDPKDVSVKRRVVRGLVGAAGVIAMLKIIVEHVFMNTINQNIATGLLFFVGIIITLGYPIVFTKLNKI